MDLGPEGTSARSTTPQQQLDRLLANPLPEDASDAELDARIAELTRLKALVEKD